MDEISVVEIPMALKLRWLRRRWTLGHLWYRSRLPLRRRRWWRGRSQLAKIYRKASDARLSEGHAVVLGDFSGRTGISRGAIYDLAKIRERHASVNAIDISDYLSGKKAVAELREPVENLYLLCQPDVYEHVLGLATPDAIKSSYRVGRWVWETAELPAGWSFAGDIVHEVWAPSDFCGSVFSRTLSLPVHVVPHAVTAPSPSSTDMRARLGISDSAFLGLAIMDIRSCPERKNPWAHVLAWQSAFGSDDNAVLVMKVRASKRTAIVLEELNDLMAGSKNIKLITDHLADEELSSLQRSCDVFLSLHRSEGYGLNVHEALLCGRPTLATDWSANHEYGPEFPNYRGIRYRLMPYRDWTNHYENGNFKWADPDILHAAAELRATRNSSMAEGRRTARVLAGTSRG
ncbi:MAG: glycosyltransferase [Hyphomicrobium sp.]|uniref:glycosyltransferase n=1 Tax=Hyphomicrobium sp. TaxID=82 RepID=UPI0039E47A82